ncbi:MAG: hypothetical protein EP340_00375 [Alphaproteobacteria bacterium]|nr:MAG: hypothetical protein EP340_00375 [Alphaproteobacteria bacterium]
MKKFGIAAFSLSVFFATPAFAGTLDEVIANGMTIETADVTYTVTMSEDGSYTTDIGIEGTWEQNGDEVCFTRTTGESSCQVLPEGKASGDSWEGETAAGDSATITIN